MTRPLAILTPTPMRRAFAVTALGCGAVFLFWTALTGSFETFAWRPVLLALGAGCLAQGLWLWRATAVALHLTEEALTDSDGTLLCRIEDITRVDRGTFAFKPSNGFVVYLNTPGPRTWAPGLWWRMGRRIGVGGVTSGAEARIMADMLTALLQHRAGA